MKTFNIKSIMALLLATTISASFSACDSDDDSDEAVKIAPTAEGSFTDERDGNTYGWVRYGNLEWMTENLRYDLNSPNCCIYLDADEYYNNPSSTRNLAKYGRLYNLKGALEACPDGWRLPTDEDWQQLEQALGMSASDAQLDGWRSNIARNMFSTKDEPAFLNLLLGGYQTENINMGRSGFRFMGIFGYYWTSSPDDSKEGDYYFCRKFLYNSAEVCRMSIDPTQVQLSARYVRDAQ